MIFNGLKWGSTGLLTNRNHLQRHFYSILKQGKKSDQIKSDTLSRIRSLQIKKKNLTASYYFASIGIFFLSLGFSTVPLYRALCQRTGFGGIPITDSRKFSADKLVPVNNKKRIKVKFSGQSSLLLPWKFIPVQKEIHVVPGETALAFFRAKNMSDEAVTGMATYLVVPEQVAPYFNKIQCFCFEQQKLDPGEEIDMPVFFFIDPDFVTDPSVNQVDDVVLHYSFFKVTDEE